MVMTLGITGGIACGKTTLGHHLAEKGFHVIETDTLAHRLYEPDKEGYKKVVDAFGTSILKEDLTVNRSALARIVFGEQGKLDLLNSIIHPLVRHAWQTEVQDLRQNRSGTSIAVTIPLLFETGCETFFDQVWCVACSREEQIKRLLLRGLEPDECQQRLNRQWPVAKKIQLSHILFWNEGKPQLLERQLNRWIETSRT